MLFYFDKYLKFGKVRMKVKVTHLYDNANGGCADYCVQSLLIEDKTKEIKYHQLLFGKSRKVTTKGKRSTLYCLKYAAVDI